MNVSIDKVEWSQSDLRGFGYYWVIKDAVFCIGKWNGHYWKLHDDPHEYNDLELMAILPEKISLSTCEGMYGWQLQSFNSEQTNFLFSEPVAKKIEFTSDEVDELIDILKSKRWQK